MIKHVLLVISLLLLAISCTPNSNYSENKTKQPIIDGVQVLHPEYPSIVALSINWYPYYKCTGTLIAPDMVLTAAHCVDETTPGSYSIAYGYEYPELAVLKKDVYQVDDHLVHPDYSPARLAEGEYNVNDIALIFLKTPIIGVTAPVLPQSLREQAVSEGKEITIAGYGMTVSPGNWFDPDAATRFPSGAVLYAAQTEIYKEFESEVWIGNGHRVDGGDASIPLLPQACYGDSGGPLYLDYEGTRYVAGVTSRLASLPACEGGTLYTLPSSYYEWIDSSYSEWLNRPPPEPPSPTPSLTAVEEAGVSDAGHQDASPDADKVNMVYINLLNSTTLLCNISHVKTNNYSAYIMIALMAACIRRRNGRLDKDILIE